VEHSILAFPAASTHFSKSMVLIGKKFHRAVDDEAPPTPVRKNKAKKFEKKETKEPEQFPPNYKTTLCTRWQSGHCEYGARYVLADARATQLWLTDSCHFAHGPKELKDLPPKKAQMCPNWSVAQPKCLDASYVAAAFC